MLTLLFFWKLYNEKPSANVSYNYLVGISSTGDFWGPLSVSLSDIHRLNRKLIGNKTKLSTFTYCLYRLKGNKTDLIDFLFDRNMSSYFDIKSCKQLKILKTIYVKQKTETHLFCGI